MPIMTAILSFLLLIGFEPVCAQAQQRTYSVSVSLHSGLPPLTGDDVKSILERASKMLQKPGHPNTGKNDVACNVRFILKGPIRSFPRADTPQDTPIRVDKAHIDAVHLVDFDVDGVDFHVKVVEKINEFCRFADAPNGLGFSGCSFPPNFHSIIVVHPATHTDTRHPDQNLPTGAFPDHVLWAHEFGHLTGLGHQADPNLYKNSLMTGCPLDAQFPPDALEQVHVTEDECNCLLAGPGFGPNGICALPGPAPQRRCNR